MSDEFLIAFASVTLIFSVLLLALVVLFRVRPRSYEDRRPSNAEVLLKARLARPPVTRVPDPMVARISELETQLRLLAERQDDSDMRRPGKSPYRLAINLARQGAGAGQIASHCGLMRGEAELITALHGRPRANRQQSAVSAGGRLSGI